MTAIKLTNLSTFPIPKPEPWRWQNPLALTSVLNGIHQVADGNVPELGHFGQDANLEIAD